MDRKDVRMVAVIMIKKGKNKKGSLKQRRGKGDKTKPNNKLICEPSR